MRITVLWNRLNSYSVAFYRALAENEECAVQLAYQPPDRNAPYAGFDLGFCKDEFPAPRRSTAALRERVEKFAPDCILMCSWSIPAYMDVALRLRRRGAFVVASMDNQWRGTLRQRLGILASPWLLKRRVDTFLVAGDRQAAFARKLGYEEPLYGLYAGETRSYWSEKPMQERDKAFLFVGRLVEEKGLRQLLEGYAAYRDRAEDPWSLRIAGTGPLSSLLNERRGVEWLGFVQPGKLPEVMSSASCMVTPSLFEPWAVVVHEAAAAHLPIIASYEVGACTYFVRDGVNGRIIPGSYAAIANAMTEISGYGVERLSEMSMRSGALAELWGPEMLARYLVERITQQLGGGLARNTLRRTPGSGA